MRRQLVFLFCLLLGSTQLFAGAVEKRAFTVEDLVRMERVGDPQVSPDGSRVVFSVTAMDLEVNHGRSDLWMATIDGSKVLQLTTDPAGDFSPRWLGNERILFLSTRSGSSQVWELSMAGGEARRLTDLPLDVESLKVSPAGDAIFVGLAVFPDCDPSIECTVSRLDEAAAQRASGKIFDRLFIRHWDTWEDGRRNHVFRLALKGGGELLEHPIDLMAGVDANCPTKPWGGDEDYAISPDGKILVYTAKNAKGSEEAWSTNYDLWAVPTDGSGASRNLTANNPAWDSAPTFSPDGKILAYLAMERAGFESDRNRIMLMDWSTGRSRILTEAWDRSPRGIVWNLDGTKLYASADNIGNHSIFSIDPKTGRAQAVVVKHSNSSPRPLPGGALLFSQDRLDAPAELYVLHAPGEKPEAITHFNDERIAGLEFGEYGQFSFTGARGDTVYGYLLFPVNWAPGKKYPLAFLIHGGPQGSFGDHFHYRWNPEIYAAHGYATVMIDFHGSTGYGQEFTDSITGDWGGAPFDDLMMGLDDVLKKHQWIDQERIAALGASYGGYMINWIQGHTKRFAALVCHDGNLDEYMAYFDTEELWFPEWEHGGTPWENPEGYRKHSPVSAVANFSTPELVIHGAKDFRVVDTQGFATFNALQRLGVPSRLLYYPDESHWVLKPLNSIQWHHVVLDWIDQWTHTEPAK